MAITSISGWNTSKLHMKAQQPQNYDFRVSQLNLPRCQSGNDCEMTTFPPAKHCEAIVALTTTAKLQQLQANNREMTTLLNLVTTAKRPWMTSQKFNNRCLRRMRFCVALWLLSFQVPLESLWSPSSSQNPSKSTPPFVAERERGG